ncbi:thiamine phosphate synthase [Aurantimonas sp. A3-2-R12]|uniref:thiamine phosphate synthase n=1 Tax=Aurantimonas sp. A3-2-R12 TaxID=3114362 RepID=UPI002E183B75|nr:thiamine phosphate synthase [Aurantimonas sp. A3-2-R12]
MAQLDYRLNPIVDAGALPGADLPALAREAALGGATLIQYRDKQASTRLMVERATAIRVALAGTGVPFVVNDRLDVALASGADGVHLGRDDMRPEEARRLCRPAAIIGLTVKNEADARAAAAAPIDYACVGGVFATLSKDNPDPPVGLEGLSRLVAIIRESRPDLPVGAIAGIELAQVPQVIAAGADGVAAISAIFETGDPRTAAQAFRATVDEALKGRGS